MTRLALNIAAVSALNLAMYAHAQDLDQKVTVAMIQHATYESLIRSLGQRAGLKVTIEPG